MKATQNRFRYVFMLIILAGLFSSTKNYGQGTWQTKANYGSLRTGTVGFSIGSKGYMGTGSNNGTLFNDFWEYDPAGNTWTQKASFAGQARQNAVGFAIGSIGYVGTGKSASGVLNDFWAYDPALNMWIQKANFPGIARHSATGLEIAGKGYLGIGCMTSGSLTSLKDFWEYDPIADIWVQKANFAGVARHAAFGFTIANKGYIGTGLNNNVPNKLGDFWEYNPLINSWTQKANFGGASRWRCVGFAIGGIGYAGSGYDGSVTKSDFWAYNTASNTWSAIPNIPTGRLRSASFVIGNKGYIGTGETVFNGNWVSPGTNNFFEFTPINPLPVELISFHAQASAGIVKTTWVTASEVNNDYFEIERSNDGKTFESIGKINGTGNSTVKLSYAFHDERPLIGVSYYRLKQTDFNGAFTYSKMERVVFEQISNSTTTVSLFPNPVTEIIFIKVNQTNADKNHVHFVLSDVNGKQVANQDLATMENSSNGTYIFERGNLEAGTYFYQVINGNHQIGSGKIIIQ